jgi:hypothetical protein
MKLLDRRAVVTGGAGGAGGIGEAIAPSQAIF